MDSRTCGDLQVLSSFRDLFIDELTPRLIERALSEWAVDHAQRLGLPGLAIDWGAWSEADMARSASRAGRLLVRGMGNRKLNRPSSSPAMRPSAGCLPPSAPARRHHPGASSLL